MQIIHCRAIASPLGKNRNIDPSKFGVHWSYWLTSHAFTHGGLVALLTGNVFLGIAETAAHWIIDFGKCEKWYGIHTDQFFHLAFKIVWFLIYVNYV